MSTLLISIFFIFQSYSYSDLLFEFDKKISSCPKKADVIADEFLLIEEKGVRVSAGKASCISGTKLKYVQAGRPLGAQLEVGAKAVKYTVVKKGSLKVDSIKELSAETLEYRVEFSGIDLKTGKSVKDSFKFMASSLAKGNKKPSFGCGHMSSYPEKTYISEECI